MFLAASGAAPRGSLAPPARAPPMTRMQSSGWRARASLRQEASGQQERSLCVQQNLLYPSQFESVRVDQSLLYSGSRSSSSSRRIFGVFVSLSRDSLSMERQSLLSLLPLLWFLATAALPRLPSGSPADSCPSV